MKAVILPTTKTADLAPLTTWAPEFLIPVVNKPIVEHLIELLVRHGVGEITLMLKHMPYETEKYFGDGSRWGVRISYALLGSYRGIVDALSRIDVSKIDGHFICLPADVLTDLDVSQFVDYQGNDKGEICCADTGSGFARQVPRCETAEELETIAAFPVIMTAEALSLMTGRFGPGGAQAAPAPGGQGREQISVTVYPSSCRYERVESLTDLASVNRHALEGRFRSVLLPGKQVKEGLWLGRHCRINAGAKLEGPILIGDRCNIEEGASVGPGSIVGDGVIIDRGASVCASLILSGTYVGAHADIKDALVKKNWMFQVPRMLHVHLGDDLILGDLEKRTLAREGERLLNMILASLVLILTSPLWVVLLCCHVLFPKRRFLRSRRLLRPDVPRGLAGEMAERTFNLFSFDGGSRFLRKIPGFINVLKGDLGLVGISALDDEETDRLPEEWKAMRVGGPLGLFHLWELEARDDLEWEEKMVIESYYLASRSTWKDLKVFVNVFFASIFR